MDNVCARLNQIIVLLAVHGIQCGFWSRANGRDAWLGDAVRGRVASAWFGRHDWDALLTWLQVQAKWHYGVDVDNGRVL